MGSSYTSCQSVLTLSLCSKLSSGVLKLYKNKLFPLTLKLGQVSVCASGTQMRSIMAYEIELLLLSLGLESSSGDFLDFTSCPGFTFAPHPSSLIKMAALERTETIQISINSGLIK